MSRYSRSSDTHCHVSERDDDLISMSEILHPFLSWFHNDIEIKALQGSAEFKYVISSSNSLLLLHTTKTDNGKYRCLITNDAGHDAIDLHLDVYGEYERVAFSLLRQPVCVSAWKRNTSQFSSYSQT